MTDELKPEIEETIQVPEVLPILPLRDVVIFPFMIVPLYVSRERSIKAVDRALSENRMILLVAQKQQEDEEPGPDDIHATGTAAVIMRMLKLPDGRIRVLVQGVSRARIVGFEEEESHLRARVEAVAEADAADKGGIEGEALMRNVKGALEKAANLGKSISPEVIVIATNMDEPGRLADLTASNLELKVSDAQDVLETTNPIERLRRVHELIAKELELLTMQQEISSQAKGEMDKSQREYFLRQQLKAIQSELGEGNELAEEVEALRDKAHKARMPKTVMEEVERQIKKLERMHPDAAETATLRNWLDWMVALPWGRSTKDNLDLKEAQRDPGRRPLRPGQGQGAHRRVPGGAQAQGNDERAASCASSAPRAWARPRWAARSRALWAASSCASRWAGCKDEAEIRGHRRTYVGAMPGRIVQGIQQAAANNPVFMLDEIDKIGADFRGDPSSALLEVLDPEQNNSFRDHYLGVPFDLSHVMFIATANLTDTIQPAFLDRMEVIRSPAIPRTRSWRSPSATSCPS